MPNPSPNLNLALSLTLHLNLQTVLWSNKKQLKCPGTETQVGPHNNRCSNTLTLFNFNSPRFVMSPKSLTKWIMFPPACDNHQHILGTELDLSGLYFLHPGICDVMMQILTKSQRLSWIFATITDSRARPLNLSSRSKAANNLQMSVTTLKLLHNGVPFIIVHSTHM